MLDVQARLARESFSLDVAFSAGPGVTALYGPSGSGKSTLLSILAGVSRADESRIVLDGTVLEDTGARIFLAPWKRPVGLVFQEDRLFPHMSVMANLLYGSRDKTIPDDLSESLGLKALAGRKIASLSGGEKQRVALGRALLARPRLLLLDEPFAGLDTSRKAELLPYLDRLIASLTMPVLYVSHVPEEVRRFATRLIQIREGRIVGVHEAGTFGSIEL